MRGARGVGGANGTVQRAGGGDGSRVGNRADGGVGEAARHQEGDGLQGFGKRLGGQHLGLAQFQQAHRPLGEAFQDRAIDILAQAELADPGGDLDVLLLLPPGADDVEAIEHFPLFAAGRLFGAAAVEVISRRRWSVVPCISFSALGGTATASIFSIRVALPI